MPSTGEALRVLELISTAGGLSDLAAQDAPAAEVFSALRKQLDAVGAAELPALSKAAAQAATAALHLIAAQQVSRPPRQASGWSTLASAINCSGAVCTLVARLLDHIGEHYPGGNPAEIDIVQGLMTAMAAAAETAAAQVRHRPVARSQCFNEAACSVAWLHVSWAALSAAVPLASMLDPDTGRAPWWCAVEAAALWSTAARLALVLLHSDAALLLSTLAAAMQHVETGWVCAIAVAHDSMLPSTIDASIMELASLRWALQAAAVHQQRAGRSCIPADPIAAAGHSSSGGGSSSSGGGSSLGGGGGCASSSAQQPPPPLLAVPALHRALLRQLPCLGVMLEQPKVVAALLDDGIRLLLPNQLQPAVVQASGLLVPLLQVLVELAVLQAHSKPVLVLDAVSAMLLLVSGCSAPTSPDQASAGSSSHSAEVSAGGLQPVQAAGVLAPVLHLLSAAVLHVLGPSAGGAGSPEDQLSSKQKADLAGQFATLVEAVVLPVAPKHLAAAICQQPLRALATLEMTVRLRTAQLPVPGEQVAEVLLELAHTVAQACAEAVRSGSLAALLPGSDSEAARLVNNHLFALLASCLKCCSRAGASVCGLSSLAAAVATAVADAAVVIACKSGSCSATHWLSLCSRCLMGIGQQLMLFTAMAVLAGTVGIRARLGQQEGEVAFASAAEAAAILGAAGSAAAVRGAPATSAASSTGAAGPPPAAAAAAAEQEQLAGAAAAAGGMGLTLLCAYSESNLKLLECGSAAAGVDLCSFVMSGSFDVLATGLQQLAEQQLQEQQEACNRSRPELLQQLALAAIDVQQQLDELCRSSLLAAHKHYPLQQQEPTPEEEDMRQCLTQAVQHNTNGINDSQGHALLDVLHHLQRLEQLGAAVCAALPPPSLACANPGCANLSGLSDMQLVWRRGVCEHCRAARFCSVACLRAHWAEHRDPGSLVAAVVRASAQ